MQNRPYVQYLLLGNAVDVAPVYDWAVWGQVVPLLTPLVLAMRERAAVRSSQLDTATNKGVAFGRLGWDEKSHLAWTHNSPRTAASCKTWLFQFTQVWAPSWSVAHRKDQPPDLFIEIHKEPVRPIQAFDQGLLIGLAEDVLDSTLSAHIVSIFPQLKKLLGCALAATRSEGWLERHPRYESLHLALDDYFTNGLYRAHEARGQLAVDQLMGNWHAM